MKNKKGQAEIWAVILGIMGGVSAWIMAARMDYGIIAKIIISLLTVVVCYFMVKFMGNQ